MTSDLARCTALVVDIDDPACIDVALVGGKAAAIARSSHAGLPVLDAVVLTTAFTAEVDRGTAITGHPALDEVFDRFGDRALVVRSSSTAEDLADSSMAGRYESVLDVTGPDALAAAVATVLASRQRAAIGSALSGDHPVAVLVQPFVEAEIGGVLFGVDPVTGRSDRLVVVAADNPELVVSGVVDGIRNALDHEGSRTDDGEDPDLPRSLRRDLAALAARTASVFGSPQDMEWLVDGDGVLRLLQCRPVTTVIRGVPQGPLYGPGPVAETFPDPLRPLERDLWVPPLQEAMREALVLAGAVTRDQLGDRPVVVAPGGWVAVDLEITGEVAAASHTLWSRLDVRPRLAALRSAWRVGRLRSALPEIALDVIDRTDKELRGVIDVAELTDRQLVALIERLQRTLVSLHGHEILTGLVIDPDASEITGASVALRVLAEARRDGRDDASIVQDNPIVLALVAPRIGGPIELPATPAQVPPVAQTRRPAGVAGLRREALRLRVRWVQELSARAVWEIAHRMTAADQLATPGDVVSMRLEELRMVFLRWSSVPTMAPLPPELDPLPGTFRLSDTGMPVRVRRPGVADEAVGAGGGRGSGPVTHDTADPSPGSILVVTTLRPDLAPVLGRLSGLIAETGSPLAHLAILAREAGVPTVVRVDDAVARFAEGTALRVDGTTGQITLDDELVAPPQEVTDR